MSIIHSYINNTMDVILKNAYFRQSILFFTWNPYKAYNAYNLWYYKRIRLFGCKMSLIEKICEDGYIKILQKVNKNIYFQQCLHQIYRYETNPYSGERGYFLTKTTYYEDLYGTYRNIDSLLIISAFHGHIEIYKFLFHQLDRIPSHIAEMICLCCIYEKNYEILKFSVNNGMTINLNCIDDFTEENLDIIVFLLESSSKNENIIPFDEESFSSFFYYCACNNRPDILEYLTVHWKCYNIDEYNITNAIDYSLVKGHIGVIACLIKHKYTDLDKLSKHKINKYNYYGLERKIDKYNFDLYLKQ